MTDIIAAIAPDMIVPRSVSFAISENISEEEIEIPEEVEAPLPEDNSGDFFDVTMEDLQPKTPGFSMRNIVGKAGVKVEGLKYEEINRLIDEKEICVKKVEKIHNFLTAFIVEKDGLINLSEEPYRAIVDEMRDTFGTMIFPEGVYSWKSKDQIEKLRESLFNIIQDNMGKVNINDMRIANLLEQIKQMLDSLRKIAEMEQHSVDKIINKSSKQGS